MSKKKKPSYPLIDIIDLINENSVLINPDVLADAMDDFGFGPEQIKSCLLKLKKKHFHKTEPYSGIPGVMIDYYKAPGIMTDVDLYTHLYIHISGLLIINSFKEL